MIRIAIIGGGGWGLALAKLLSDNSHQVLVWEYNAKYLNTLIEKHENTDLLPGVQLPESIVFTGSPQEVAALDPNLIILSTPSQFIRTTLGLFLTDEGKSIWTSPQLSAVINVAKGIEQNTLLTIDAILCELLPPECHAKICALSGPSHAEEVAMGLPTTVVLAGKDVDLLNELQQIFSNSYFRVYRSTDLIGVEIGGAVKNIIAIAAGIVAGLGLGDNTIGALLTRGIVEIKRLGAAMGASPETFMGLSGIGDLITTAISKHSRNRYVGFEIGKGRSLTQIKAEMNMVAEGVATTKSVYELALAAGVEMPIVGQVFEVLYRDKDPREAITDLMTRSLKAE